MARSKELNDLEVSVVVPKFSNSGRRIRNSRIEEIGKELSEKFGGVTIQPSVLGCWKSNDGDLMCEENIKMTSALDAETNDMSKEEASRTVESMGEDIADEFGQAAVMTSEEFTEVDFVGRDDSFKEELSDDKTGGNPFNRLL
jgi:hypothetical protein